MIEAQAVCIAGKGGVEALSLGALQVGEPGPNELLVRVAAAGLNRADILQRKGFYPAPAGSVAHVPGLEYAGLLVQGEGFAARIPPRGCDVILDTVGAAYLADNIKALATRGRLVVVGLLGGAAAELPLGLLLAKRARVIGTVLRSRALEEKAS